MKFDTFAPTKSRAQAMVEFAIVLPLLLLLLYGLLEAGRLLFMYSTVVTATRQASRYGSATGQGGDYTAIGGPDNSNVPRYQDCYGIRLAAQRVDFLNSFDDANILIQYDGGPGTAIADTCDGDADTDVEPSIDNDSRIVVTVEGSFFPIVPRIVPFIERSVANGSPIRAISARTIVIAISIEVTPPPGAGVPPPAGTNQLALTMRAEPSTYAFPGEIINLFYDLTNNGTVPISGISLAPTHGGYTCPATTLDPGASMTCSGAYQITQADVDARSVTAQGVATGTDGTNTVTSNTGTVTLTWVEQPRLQLAKGLSTEYATTGGTVTYTFTVTNTGNVPLTSIAVSDPQLGGAVAACAGDLPVATSITCSAPYVVTQNDVNRNPLVNTATATALFNGQTITSDPASATLWTGPLFLSVSASPASTSTAGQVITYTYQLINNTGVELNPPYTITGERGTEDCSANTGTIPAGGYILCSGTYTVTQADLDNEAPPNNQLSRVLANEIVATACLPGPNCNGPRQVTSNTRPVSVTLVRAPALTMAIAAATPNPATTLNTVITYTYTVTNTGNVTLTPSLTDNRVTNATCPGALAPGASYNCTGTYTVTQADLDAGSITNQATASAIFAGQTVSSASQSITVLTFVGPRIRLQVTPNPTTYTSAGDFIVYTYTMTNTGSVPIYGPFTITDNKVTSFDCNTATSPLGIGGSTYCVGSYAVTQTDVDNGSVTNSASVAASDGLQLVTSNSAMAVVYVPGAPTLTPGGSTPVAATPTATATATATSTPTATNAPVTNLKVQLQANGTDNNQRSRFSMRVQNLGTSAESNVSVRIYFTLDGSNLASNYRLTRQSGDAATITGPTLASGTTYYFTVSRATALAAGGTWSVNLEMDLVSGGNTFNSGNDWWHNGTGGLPNSFTDWLRIPAYVNGTRVWGNEPP